MRLDGVLVPDERIIAPICGNAATTPQLRLPLGNRLAYNKAAVAIGIARAGIDAFVELATRKQPRFTSRPLRDRPFAQRAVANAEAPPARLPVGALGLDRAELGDGVRRRRCGGGGERAVFQIVAADAARTAVEVGGHAVRSGRHLGQPHRRAA